MYTLIRDYLCFLMMCLVSTIHPPREKEKQQNFDELNCKLTDKPNRPLEGTVPGLPGLSAIAATSQLPPFSLQVLLF